MAEGLERCLDLHPHWPPGAAQYRALCLNIEVDEKGKEVVRRAGIYSTKPTESMLAKRQFAIESDDQKKRRKAVADKTIDNLLGMF